MIFYHTIIFNQRKTQQVNNILTFIMMRFCLWFWFLIKIFICLTVNFPLLFCMAFFSSPCLSHLITHLEDIMLCLTQFIWASVSNTVRTCSALCKALCYLFNGLTKYHFLSQAVLKCQAATIWIWTISSQLNFFVYRHIYFA